MVKFCESCNGAGIFAQLKTYSCHTKCAITMNIFKIGLLYFGVCRPVGRIDSSGGENMTRVVIIVIVIVGLFAAGLAALSSWNIPAPTTAINKVVSDENLPK